MRRYSVANPALQLLSMLISAAAAALILFADTAAASPLFSSTFEHECELELRSGKGSADTCEKMDKNQNACMI